MEMVTERLVLRPWSLSDAPAMFALCSDPAVGPIAGWPPHKSVDESTAVISSVLGPEAYAICLKSSGALVGCIELKLGERNEISPSDSSCEMGYWLGSAYWGQGLMTEAVREMQRHAFEDLGMDKIWIGYYDGNERSARVQRNCGFIFQWTTPDVDVPLMGETRVGHVSLLTREAKNMV